MGEVGTEKRTGIRGEEGCAGVILASAYYCDPTLLTLVETPEEGGNNFFDLTEKLTGLHVECIEVIHYCGDVAEVDGGWWLGSRCMALAKGIPLHTRRNAGLGLDMAFIRKHDIAFRYIHEVPSNLYGGWVD